MADEKAEDDEYGIRQSADEIDRPRDVAQVGRAARGDCSMSRDLPDENVLGLVLAGLVAMLIAVLFGMR